MALHLVGNPSNRQRLDELIGEKDPMYAASPKHSNLLDCGCGDSPRSRVQLPLYDLRSHRGLAVWRQRDAPIRTVLRHQPDVVVECLLLERHDGKEQVSRQGVPTLMADISNSYHLVRGGEALEAPINGFAQDRLQNEPVWLNDPGDSVVLISRCRDDSCLLVHRAPPARRVRPPILSHRTCLTQAV